MVGEAVAVTVCLLLWGARACLAAKYVLKYRMGGEDRRAWKPGTPGWVIRIMPWLEFLGWVVLLGCIAWWVLRPVPVVGATRPKWMSRCEFAVLICLRER
jgi:hypothetical protein